MANHIDIWRNVLIANAERHKTENPVKGRLVRADKVVEIKHVPGESLSYWDKPGFIRESILSDLNR